jgi:hypothetical protein
MLAHFAQPWVARETVVILSERVYDHAYLQLGRVHSLFPPPGKGDNSNERLYPFQKARNLRVVMLYILFLQQQTGGEVLCLT